MADFLDGPFDANKKAVPSCTAFKQCVRAAGQQVWDRIPVNPDPDAPVNAVQAIVSLPGSG